MDEELRRSAGGDVPGPDVPGPDVPGEDVPGADVPGPDVAGGPDVPGSDVPGPDVPRPDVPGPDVPGPDVPGLKPGARRGRPFRTEMSAAPEGPAHPAQGFNPVLRKTRNSAPRPPVPRRDTPDVVIVGGGPAGLATAIATRGQGLEVVVVDRARPPIDKACGEGLMPDGLALLCELGVELDAERQHPFHGIRYLDGDTVAEGRSSPAARS